MARISSPRLTVGVEGRTDGALRVGCASIAVGVADNVPPARQAIAASAKSMAIKRDGCFRLISDSLVITVARPSFS